MPFHYPSLFKNIKASIELGHSDKDNDRTRSSHHHSGNHSNRRRLERSKNIRRSLQYSCDDLNNDTSRNPLFSTGQASEIKSGFQRNHSVSPARSSIESGNSDKDNDSLRTRPSHHHSGNHSSRRRLERAKNIRGLRYSYNDLNNDTSRNPLFISTGHASEITFALTCGANDPLPPPLFSNSSTLEPTLQRNHSVSSAISWDEDTRDSDENLGYSSDGDSSNGSLENVASHDIFSVNQRCSDRSAPSGSSILESGPLVGKWQKGCLLGIGGFSRVYKGIHSETGEFCAIKEVEYVEDDTRSKESAKQLQQEIMFLSSFRHPNIVHYKGSEMAGRFLNIYLELVLGGSIYKLCQEFKRLEEPIVRRYTRQILNGLQFLHSQKIVHRDIKGANILVDQEGTVRLADFGIAKEIKQQGPNPLSFKGSPYWMAPEVIMQVNTTTGFEYAVDIWSLGCTVLEMLTGKHPWSKYEGAAAMVKFCRGEIPPLPQGLSSAGRSFIKQCLQQNPADRPSADALLRHRFVQFPNEGSNCAVQKTKILRKLVGQSYEERCPTEQNSGVSSGLSRDGSHPVTRRPYSRARMREDIHPSRSAPVSPRFPHEGLYDSTSPSAEFSVAEAAMAAAGYGRQIGFSTPQPSSPTGMGFSIRPQPAGNSRCIGIRTPQPGSPRGMGLFFIPTGGSPRHTGLFTPTGGSPQDEGFSRSPAGSPSGGMAFDYYINQGQG